LCRPKGLLVEGKIKGKRNSGLTFFEGLTPPSLSLCRPTGFKVSQPSQPSKPAKPSKPSQPSEPSKPSKPSKPAKPSKPSKLSQPSKPSKPFFSFLFVEKKRGYSL